jgi:uncharacterized damage-inducible protein DinB
MRLADRILIQLKSTYDGSAWHGTPLRKMIEGIDDATANARPISNARTIAELTAHIAGWMEIAERRARGEAFEVTRELDFPSVDGVAWRDIVRRLERAHAQLVATVGAMTDEALEAKVPRKRHSQEYMLHGVAHHNTYHAAQMALLKKVYRPK